MGSNLIIREREYCDQPTLKKWVADEQHQAAYEDGSQYSGNWNMCPGLFINEAVVYPNVQAAHDYIADHQQKWESLYAVPALVAKQVPLADKQSDAKYAELHKACEELQRLIDGQDRAIVARAKAAKSKFKACSHCESKVSVAHLHYVKCPVCGGQLLRTATDDKQREAWKAKLEQLNAKKALRVAALAKKLLGDNRPVKVWVIGGWCAS